MTTSPYRFRVTFTVYSTVLKKTFTNIELHRSEADARLRALALGWTIVKIENLEGESV